MVIINLKFLLISKFIILAQILPKRIKKYNKYLKEDINKDQSSYDHLILSLYYWRLSILFFKFFPLLNLN